MMSTDTSPPPTLVMQKLYTSPVAHFVDLRQPVTPDMNLDRLPSLCQVRPIWPGVWLPLNETDDTKMCKVCEAVKEATERVGDS